MLENFVIYAEKSYDDNQQNSNKGIDGAFALYMGYRVHDGKASNATILISEEECENLGLGETDILVAIAMKVGQIIYLLETDGGKMQDESIDSASDRHVCDMGLDQELLHLLTKSEKFKNLPDTEKGNIHDRIFIIKSLNPGLREFKRPVDPIYASPDSYDDNADFENDDYISDYTLEPFFMDYYGVVYHKLTDIIQITKPLIGTYEVDQDTVSIMCQAFQPWHKWEEGKFTLKRVILNSELTSIGDDAFNFNESLEYINIPVNVVGIGNNPFAGCKNLHRVDIQNEYFEKEGTLLFNKEHSRLIACLPSQYVSNDFWELMKFVRLFGTKKTQICNVRNSTSHVLVFTNLEEERTLVYFSKKLGELSVQELVEKKNELYVMKSSSGSFFLCGEKELYFHPDKVLKLKFGLKTIDNNAFYNDSYLEEITLPETLETIGMDAFKGCTSLRTINIPLGSRSKFENLLPEFKDYIVEVQSDEQRRGIGPQVAAQIAENTGNSICTTSHLLLLHQLLGNSPFLYKKASNGTEEITYLFDDKGNLYLPENINLPYFVPFLWIKKMAQNNSSEFDKKLDALNSEFQADTNGMETQDIISGIRQNGFIEFRPRFDINVNRDLLITFYKDSRNLKELISFFGDNVAPSSLMNSRENELNIPWRSQSINGIAKEIIVFFKKMMNKTENNGSSNWV